MPEVKGFSYCIFWGCLSLAGAQQNVALNCLRYKVAILFPGVKNSLHAVNQPLVFELHQHCATADDGYTQTLGYAFGAALVDQIQQRVLCRVSQHSDFPGAQLLRKCGIEWRKAAPAR